MTITDPADQVELTISAADALRALAEVLDQKPELCKDGGRLTVCANRMADADEFPDLVKALGGHRTKVVNEESATIDVVRDFGGGVTFSIWTFRSNTCERVQVGEQTVERTEVVTPAVTRTVTVTEPVYEWDCSPVLAISDDAKAAAAEGLPAARGSLAEGVARTVGAGDGATLAQAEEDDAMGRADAAGVLR